MSSVEQPKPQPSECMGCGKHYLYPCHGKNESCPNYQHALRHGTVPGTTVEPVTKKSAGKPAPKRTKK